MNSFKEKFKIAKILASLFTHSSTPEEEKNYRAWLDENPEHQKIADRILNKETYEENSRLIKSFSSQKAWEKVYPLLGGNQSGTVFSWKNRHKAQRKAKFYINKCRSASCMQSGWKRTPA